MAHLNIIDAKFPIRFRFGREKWMRMERERDEHGTPDMMVMLFIYYTF